MLKSVATQTSKKKKSDKKEPLLTFRDRIKSPFVYFSFCRKCRVVKSIGDGNPITLFGEIYEFMSGPIKCKKCGSTVYDVDKDDEDFEECMAKYIKMYEYKQPVKEEQDE